MINENIKYKINNNVLIVNASHLHQHPEMNELLHDAFEKFLEKEKNYSQKVIKLEVKMNKIIGKTSCIITNEDSEVFYAQRKGRNTFSRFVKNIDPQDCDTITMIVSKGRTNVFHLITSYIGYIAEKEPLDSSIKNEEEFLICKKFWSNHALIDGSQNIYKNTITNTCPWDNFNNRPKIELGNKNNILDIINNMRKPNINESKNNKENKKSLI